MPFYEIIYEPGTKSVAFYENDEEATSALTAHNERATSGQPATPENSATHPDADAPQAVGTWAAERPIKVFVYPTHPADFEPQIDTSQLTGTNTEQLEQLRSQINPLAENPGVQDSQYKQQPERELALNF